MTRSYRVTEGLLALIPVILALAFTIIFTGGAEGNSLAPFNPSSAGSLGGLAFGLIFGMLLYTGYESAAVLAEERGAVNRRSPVPPPSTT